jgi:hypothetical protein
MAIKGTVTRVADGRVFFRPLDPADARELDSTHVLASGEIVIPAGDTKYEVGQTAEFTIGLPEDDAPEKKKDEDKPPEGPPPETESTNA